jgi:hypothetical protein
MGQLQAGRRKLDEPVQGFDVQAAQPSRELHAGDRGGRRHWPAALGRGRLGPAAEHGRVRVLLQLDKRTVVVHLDEA